MSRILVTAVIACVAFWALALWGIFHLINIVLLIWAD